MSEAIFLINRFVPSFLDMPADKIYIFARFSYWNYTLCQGNVENLSKKVCWQVRTSHNPHDASALRHS